MAKSKETVKGRLRSTDLVPRILCVVVALVVWLYVLYNSSPDFEKTFVGVEIDIKGESVLAANGYAVYDDDREPMEIVVVGKRGEINTIRKEDITVSIDVGSINKSGINEVPVTISVPDTATVKNYYPKRVKVDVQEVIEKQVPIKVVCPGFTTPFEKYELRTVEEENVTVRGPKIVVDTIHYVEARHTFAGEVMYTTRVDDVELVPCKEGGGAVDITHHVDIVPSNADIEVVIFDEKTVPIEVKTVYEYLDDSNSRISVEPAEVTLRMRIDSNETLDTLGAFASVIIDETANASDGSIVATGNKVTYYGVPIEFTSKAEIDDGISTADVVVNHRGTREIVFPTGNITVYNPDKVSYRILTENLPVTLRISEGDISALSSATVVLHGNLADEKAGKIPVKVDVEGDFEDVVYAVGEYFVSVRIDK